MTKNAIFIAATGQHVGKTTLCLGILAALQKRFRKVGFIKPVGQQHVKTQDGAVVDKDVVLFKEYFQLDTEYDHMSPVIVPSGFTRRFLDGDESQEKMLEKIERSFDIIAQNHPFTIVEGTGHVGVGTIVNLNNVQVAKALELDMVIIVSGGLGSTIDELALNLAMCEKHGVNVRGVIINRVIENKRDMIQEYIPKALDRWGIPLIGTVPYNEFLSNPTMRDFEALFRTSLISGKTHHYRHFQHTRLVAGSLDTFLKELIPNELIITPASREDIIRAYLEKHQLESENGIDFQGGMILTGRELSQSLIDEIRQVDIPVMTTTTNSYDAMKMITSYIAKIRLKDTPKIEQAIRIIEKHVNFELLI